MIRWLMADKQNENQQLMQKHDNYTSDWLAVNVELNTHDKGTNKRKDVVCLKQNQMVSGKAQVDTIKLSVAIEWHRRLI